MIKRFSPNSSSRSRAPFARKVRKVTDGYDDSRPVMEKKDFQKKRYKLPKVAKAPVAISVYEKRPTSNDNRPMKIHKGAPHKKLPAKSQPSKAAPVTSWGGVAEWYDSHLASDTYHEKVIMPNLFRMIGEIQRKDILDLACGQGHISRVLQKGGARVTGADISAELITYAKIKNDEEKVNVAYVATPSHKLEMFKDGSFDIVICVLAIQNIEKVAETFKECNRILRPNGRLFVVMNHPAFRIPQGSGWGFDEAESIQYRRVDQYLGEAKIRIDMTPGREKGKEYTISFHRPLQYYSKLLNKSGFAIARIEEWESHKKSGKGPRQRAEDTARKEIPLFMALEMVKV